MSRLYAYGGTRFAERRRLGTWNLKGAEALSTQTGIPADGVAVGLVWDSGAAALLLRQIQRDEFQRRNPFSMFFDPGLDAWKRFEWNAAALALALLGRDGQPGAGEELLSRPEDWTAERLAAFSAQLQPPAMPRGKDDVFLSIWCGAMLEGDLVATHFSALGLDLAHLLENLGERMAGVAPCFRAGCSWLAGGNRSQARSLGIQLVLNDFESDKLPEGLAERGRLTARRWQAAVAASPDFAVFDETPIPLWEGEAARVVECAETLGSFVLGEDRREELLHSIVNARGDAGPARREIRREALAYVLGGSSGLDERRSGLALTLAAGEELPETALPRLHQSALLKHFVEHPQAPMRGLPEEARAEIWRARLARARHLPALEPLFVAALSDLPAAAHPALLEFAVRKAMPHTPLWEWDDFFRRHPHWHGEARAWLTQEAMASVAARSTDFIFDYLAFAEDREGVALREAGLSPAELGEVVESVVAVAMDKGPRAAMTKQWLASLATSPLRRRIPMTAKLAVTELGLPEWKGLRRLHDYYSGDPAGSSPRKEVGEPERSLLLAELDGLFALPYQGHAPRLRALDKLLGSLPKTAAEGLRRLAHTMPLGARSDLVRELRAIEWAGLADELAAHEAVHAPSAELRREFLESSSEESLAAQFRQFLLESQPTEAEAVERLRQTMETAGGEKRLEQKVAGALARAYADTGMGMPPVSLLAAHPEVLIFIVARRPEEQQLEALADWEQLDRQAVRARALEASRLLRAESAELTPPDLALLRYLHCEGNGKLRRMVGEDAFHGAGGAKALEAKLVELFGPTWRPAVVRPELAKPGFFHRFRGFFKGEEVPR